MITDAMKNLVDEELGDIDTGYYHWKEYRDETILGIIKLYEQNKWVSVNDRLPEVDITVLVRLNDGSYELTHRKEGGFGMWSGITLHDIVTHWQPLPEFKE